MAGGQAPGKVLASPEEPAIYTLLKMPGQLKQ